MHFLCVVQAGYTPLMLAAACGVEISNHQEVVALLIERGNVNAVVQQVSWLIHLSD